MKVFKRILLGAISLLVVGGLASCGEENGSQIPVIPEHQHTIVTDPGVEATCDADGLTEGSHCSTCKEIIVRQNVIPALGHDGMVCSRCSKADITEEFVINMSNSIDWKNGVLLSMPDCDVRITLKDGTTEISYIVIPEIYVNLSTSTEIYGRLSASSEDFDNTSIDTISIKFKLVDDMLILNKEDTVSIDGVDLSNYNQNYALSLSYLEKSINNLYIALIESKNIINNIQQVITEYQNEIETVQQYIIEYKDVVGNINLDMDTKYPSNLINTIFDAKIDGDTYVISNNKKLMGEVFKEIVTYLNNNSIEDIVNDYVKGTIEEEFYDDYFIDGAFNTIFNKDAILSSYDNIQAILEGIKLEDIINYVESLLEEKMGIEHNDEEPYSAIMQAAYIIDSMISKYIKETNGVVLSTVSSLLQNIPDMSLYELALYLTNDNVSKDNILFVVDILNSIKGETIIGLILSNMGIEIDPLLFDAYLTILTAEIDKFNKKFDYSIVTSKTGVIQSINMSINDLQTSDKLFRYSFKLSFGEYTATLEDYSFVTDIINEYNENMNKVNHEMFDIFNGLVLDDFTIVDVSEDGKTLTLTNNYTNVTAEYVLSDAMLVDSYKLEELYSVYYCYQSENDEVIVMLQYNENGLSNSFILNERLLEYLIW